MVINLIFFFNTNRFTEYEDKKLEFYDDKGRDSLGCAIKIYDGFFRNKDFFCSLKEDDGRGVSS